MGELTRVDAEVPEKVERPARAEWSLAEIERAAQYIAKSGLFGVKDPVQAVALMLLAQAEGTHPARAVQEYHIINGRPALRADAMLARFLAAGGRVEWHVLTDERAEATFSHPQGGTVRLAWTLEDAKRAGLLDKKDGNWHRYPRAMLRARLISEGVRTVYPGVATGVYTPEEVMDLPEPAQVVSAPTPAPTTPATPATPEPARATEDHNGARFPTDEQLRLLKVLINRVGLSREDARLYISAVIDRKIESAGDMTREEAGRAIEHLQTLAGWMDELMVPEELRRKVMRDAAALWAVFDSQETLVEVLRGYEGDTAE
jgi:hypothetical protein